MRKFFYILSYPIVWILNEIFQWWWEFRNAWKEHNFRYAFRHYLWENIRDSIHDFLYEDHHNGIFGPGGHGWSTFKSGNLALVIAILTAIGFILYVILT